MWVLLTFPWAGFGAVPHVWWPTWENLFNTSHIQGSAELLFIQLSTSSTEHSKNSCLFHVDCWKFKNFRSQTPAHLENTPSKCAALWFQFTHPSQELLLGSEPLQPCRSDKFNQPRLLLLSLQDTDIFLAGTEEGHIHCCSCSGKEQILGTYRGHKVSGTLNKDSRNCSVQQCDSFFAYI